MRGAAGESLALVAGAGALPAQAAAALRKAGQTVFAIGFEGLTDASIESAVSGVRWLELGQIEALGRALEALEVSRVLLLGKVPKSFLFAQPSRVTLDAEGLRLLEAQPDLSDDRLMGAIAGWLERRGFALVDQRVALASMLVSIGTLTKREPNDQAKADLALGLPVLRALGEVGVGQCVVVKSGAILALEAIEGTDETIRRAGRLAGPGATIIKGLRPGQDQRFDLPAVGPDTLGAMIEAGALALAVEAETTLLVGRDRFIDEADRAGLMVWGFESPRATTP